MLCLVRFSDAVPIRHTIPAFLGTGANFARGRPATRDSPPWFYMFAEPAWFLKFAGPGREYGMWNGMMLATVQTGVPMPKMMK